MLQWSCSVHCMALHADTLHFGLGTPYVGTLELYFFQLLHSKNFLY